MSRLDDLIHELCPTGVSKKPLGEMTELVRGQHMTKDLAVQGPYSIVSASREALGFHSEFNHHGNAVTISSHGAYAGFVSFWPKKIWLGNNVFLFECLKALDSRFLYFVLKSRQAEVSGLAKSGGVPYINASQVQKLMIPTPPLEIQKEIVRILDTFTELEAELEAELGTELEARKKQFSFYRNSLLFEQGAVQNFPLREIAEFQNAKAHEKLVDADGDIALITAKFISTRGASARFVHRADVLTPVFKGQVALVMSDLPNGKALAKTFFVDEDDRYAANQRICMLTPKKEGQLDARYLYHFMNRNQQLLSYDNGTDQTHLKKDYILDVQVAVPSIETQKQITQVLDDLENILESLTEALPAEIEARRKQYGHYRDRLLTFKELAA